MNTAQNSARIQSIHIAAASRGALQEIDVATLIAGRGIEGDRFCIAEASADGQDDAQVSLVEAEQVESVAAAAGFGFEAKDTRRNIVTRGIDLNALVGKTFSIGEVELRGVELAEPCAYLAGRLIKQFDLASAEPREIVAGLAHRGGLYAEIVRGGTIRPGDQIVAGD